MKVSEWGIPILLFVIGIGLIIAELQTQWKTFYVFAGICFFYAPVVYFLVKSNEKLRKP